jgi:hypothetical protein
METSVSARIAQRVALKPRPTLKRLAAAGRKRSHRVRIHAARRVTRYACGAEISPASPALPSRFPPHSTSFLRWRSNRIGGKRVRIFSANTGDYQLNWQTLKIGNKFWGLSPSRLYDFETGRFTSRDWLRSLTN